MPREPRNIGASVRARLLDRARAERSDFQILLTRYALERLLYRLSVSEHRDRFILKGAMLFVTWVADPFRPTRDLDLLGLWRQRTRRRLPIRSARSVRSRSPMMAWSLISSVCRPRRSAKRWNMAACGCGRQRRSPARAFRSRSTSASATPSRRRPSRSTIPTLLDAPAPHLRAYPVETVVAEKFEALVTLGIANSRLKDFYDLWLIAQTFEFRQSSPDRSGAAHVRAAQDRTAGRYSDRPDRRIRGRMGCSMAGLPGPRAHGRRAGSLRRGHC